MSELYETLVVEAELKLAISRLAEWAAPRPVEKNLLTLTDEAYVKPEPLGVVLIIGPWNYPWALTLLPLVGAIAAGSDMLLIICFPSVAVTLFKYLCSCTSCCQ